MSSYNDNPYDGDPGIIEVEMWEDFVDRVNRPRLNSPEAHALHNQGKLLLGKCGSHLIHAIVPDAAIEEDDVDHAIFLAWRALRQAIDERSNRLMEEEMAAAYEPDPATCVLCGGPVEPWPHRSGQTPGGWGHNPEPLAQWPARCCDACNTTKVIPERLRGWLQ